MQWVVHHKRLSYLLPMIFLSGVISTLSAGGEPITDLSSFSACLERVNEYKKALDKTQGKIDALRKDMKEAWLTLKDAKAQATGSDRGDRIQESRRQVLKVLRMTIAEQKQMLRMQRHYSKKLHVLGQVTFDLPDNYQAFKDSAKCLEDKSRSRIKELEQQLSQALLHKSNLKDEFQQFAAPAPGDRPEDSPQPSLQD